MQILKLYTRPTESQNGAQELSLTSPPGDSLQNLKNEKH